MMLALTAVASAAGEKLTYKNAMEDLGRALMQQSTRWPPDPPLEMSAKISFPDGPLEWREGRYHLIRQDASHWRETVTFGAYVEEIVRSGEWEGTRRNLDFQPVRVQLFLKAMRLGCDLQAPSEENVKKVRAVKVDGGETVTFVCRDKREWSFTLAGNPKLLRKVSYEDNQTLYDEEKSLGGFLLCTRMTVKKGPHTAYEIEYLDARTPESFSEGLFVLPEDASIYPAVCKGGQQGVRATVAPEYPRGALERERGGQVTVFCRIDENGALVSTRVIQTSWAELSAAAETAVRKWTFHRWVCGDKAYPYDWVVRVNFKLP